MVEPKWAEIETEYRAAQLSVRAIAAKYSVAPGEIMARARTNGWSRDLQAHVRDRIRERLHFEQVPTEVVMDKADEIASRAVQVILGHRTDIREARETFGLLLSHLKALAGAGSQTVPPEVLKVLVGKSDLPTALNTLTQTLERLVKMERAAFDIDALAPSVTVESTGEGGGTTVNLYLPDNGRQ